MAGSAKRFDAWAALSLGLAVFLMVLPIEADIILGLMLQHNVMLAADVAVLCSVAVLLPFTLSWRRHRSQPGHWRGHGYLTATCVILVLNSLMFTSVFGRELLWYMGTGGE